MRISQPERKKLVTACRQNGVLAVYLFGSATTRTRALAGDIDLALLMPYKLSKSERFRARTLLIEKCSTIFRKKVDVVILNDVTSTILKQRVISLGSLIFVSDNRERLLFELRTMQEYADWKPFLDFYDKHYVEGHG